MHMADALLSPVVGGGFWVAAASLIGYSAKKIAAEKDNTRTPLMGVLAAFVFAAQMINFTIPGTGSSGHIGGGLLLAALLGPHRAFIAIASVLTVQSLFFADGGLLALGCNIFNLGFFPAFFAYPLVYRLILGSSTKPWRLAAACIVAAEAGILLGAFSVVAQTVLSGVTELPFTTFILFMIPIHAAIGLGEGLATWGVLSFVNKSEPGLIASVKPARVPRFIVAALAAAALVTGGAIAWFASSHPDGLEWSMERVTGAEEFERAASGIHELLAAIQERISFLPDYSFRPSAVPSAMPTDGANVSGTGSSAIDAGTSVSGIFGSVLVLLLAGAAGFIIRARTPAGRKAS